MKLVRVEAIQTAEYTGRVIPEHVINLDAVVEVYYPTGDTLKARNEVALLMANRTTFLLSAREWRRALRLAGATMPPPRTRPQ
ncbi:MAG TPA: hypothetical protein VMU89_14655 [Thermomicrobiaceae bacterium]|nr:hypothetical protein [Thermomicrobiaceae bacterium]